MVVAVNVFPPDTEAEHGVIREAALAAGADDCVRCTHHAEGGAGAAELGAAVVRACEGNEDAADFKLLYPDSSTIKEKIATVAKELYRAADVSYSPQAEEKIAQFAAQGFDHLPICMAKTQYSFSHDADAKGAPVHLAHRRRETQRAGFVVPLVGAFPTIGSAHETGVRDRHGPGDGTDHGPVVSASEGREPHSPWRRGRASGGGGGGGKRSGAVVSRGWKRRLLARREIRRAIVRVCEIRYAIVHVLQHVFVFVTHSAAAAVRPPALIAASISLPRSRGFADLCFFPSQCASELAFVPQRRT